MPFPECKIYNDGSHYIAIPHTNNPHKKRFKKKEETITVSEENQNNSYMGKENQENAVMSEINTRTCENEEDSIVDDLIEVDIAEILSSEDIAELKTRTKPQNGRRITRKQYFEELYKATTGIKRKERRTYIINAMLPYFRNEKDTTQFVDLHLDRKHRNLVCRRVRLTRKINLNDFNYFCTFTYDGAKHTEESFKKGLKQLLRNMTYRKEWKYAGVWERSPTTGRLHFHGLFDIPNGTLPGTFEDITDYNITKHKRQTTKVNSYFLERFGRNDFKEIDDKAMLGESIAYLTKYIEKTGEKIVYSKNLPMYFISDIMDEDVVCTIGQEDKKLLLFDDFACWDEGCHMGTVSPEVIKQMRKAN